MKTRFKRSLTSLAVACALSAGLAHAELARVGPIGTAGFPQWFQDKNGLALDLCIPKDQADLAAMNCLLGTAEVAALPEVFPTNWFDEHFWFAAGAAIDTTPLGAPGGKASLTLATEAAFSAAVANGNQIVFNRIRVLLNPVPADGTYRFITPYVTMDFPDVVAGSRIFFTDDVGVGCPEPDFSCALSSNLGPYLRASDSEGGAALPLVQVNGTTMITDPALPTFVTGGSNGNKFRIEYYAPGLTPGVDAPSRVAETNQFNVMGRVHTDRIASPMSVARATYTRKDGPTGTTESYIDVFASAQAGLAGPGAVQATPNLSIVPAGGVQGSLMSAGTPDLQQVYPFWGQAAVTGTVPASVQVINNADVPPTVMAATVTDAVTITEALFDPQAGRLTVKARSSDTASGSPAQLSIEGLGVPCDDVVGASIATNVAPARVTVLSNKGGKATVPVLVKTAARPFQIPDGTVSTLEDTPIEVNLAAISGVTTGGTFTIHASPTHGSLVLINGGSYAYAPAANYFGPDSMSFTVTAGGQTSSVATVAINVTSVNDAPQANADTATTTVGTPVVINVLANDVDPDTDTGIDPATVTPTGVPAGLSVTVNPTTGAISATSNAAGAYSFSYTVKDKGIPAMTSNPATVNVTVNGAETMAITRARYLVSKNRWQIDGTTNIADGQSITLYSCLDVVGNQPDCSNAGADKVLIGTATVGAGGAWAIDQIGPIPPNPAALTAVSARGGKGNADVARK
jgi:hypothetical protein